MKKNMRGQNFDKDRWLSKVRLPFEGVFAAPGKKARYRSLIKIVAEPIPLLGS
jgi:IS5 family transposase